MLVPAHSPKVRGRRREPGVDYPQGRGGRCRLRLHPGGIDAISSSWTPARQLVRIGRNIGAVLGVMFSGVAAPAGSLLDSLEGVTERGARAFAGTARGSKVFGQVVATVGAILATVFGTLQRVAGVIGNVFGPILPDILEFVEALANLKSTVVDTALDALEPILAGIGDVFGGVVLPALTALAGFLGENRAVVQGVGIAIMTLLVPAFVAWAISAGIAAIKTIIAMGPIILLGAAIAGLATLVIIHFDTIKEVVWVSSTGSKTTGRCCSASSPDRSGSLWSAIAKHWDTIKQAITAAVTFVINFVKNNWRPNVRHSPGASRSGPRAYPPKLGHHQIRVQGCY